MAWLFHEIQSHFIKVRAVKWPIANWVSVSICDLHFNSNHFIHSERSHSSDKGQSHLVTCLPMALLLSHKFPYGLETWWTYLNESDDRWASLLQWLGLHTFSSSMSDNSADVGTVIHDLDFDPIHAVFIRRPPLMTSLMSTLDCNRSWTYM